MTTPTLTPQEYILIKASLNRLKYAILSEARNFPENSPEQTDAYEMADKLSKLARKFDSV